MVMPFCFDNVKDMFEKSAWNYTQFARDCHKKWNTMPRPDMADLMYGERKLQGASNIVFTNGLVDPWSSGGGSFSSKIHFIALVREHAHLQIRYQLEFKRQNACPLSILKYDM